MKTKRSSSTKTTLNIELARAGLNQSQLAAKLDVPSTTLSDWLRGAHPGPTDLMQRIEKVLSLKAGSLSSGEVSDER